MRDNVGVTVLAEIKPDTKAARAGIGTRIWDLGKACGAGEAEDDGGRRAVKVGCNGEILATWVGVNVPLSINPRAWAV